jgi:hypothetical protein
MERLEDDWSKSTAPKEPLMQFFDAQLFAHGASTNRTRKDDLDTFVQCPREEMGYHQYTACTLKLESDVACLISGSCTRTCCCIPKLTENTKFIIAMTLLILSVRPSDRTRQMLWFLKNIIDLGVELPIDLRDVYNHKSDGKYQPIEYYLFHDTESLQALPVDQKLDLLKVYACTYALHAKFIEPIVHQFHVLSAAAVKQFAKNFYSVERTLPDSINAEVWKQKRQETTHLHLHIDSELTLDCFSVAVRTDFNKGVYNLGKMDVWPGGRVKVSLQALMPHRLYPVQVQRGPSHIKFSDMLSSIKMDDCTTFIKSLISLDALLRSFPTDIRTPILFRFNHVYSPHEKYDDDDRDTYDMLEHFFDIRMWDHIPRGLKVTTIITVPNPRTSTTELVVGVLGGSTYSFKISRHARSMAFLMEQTKWEAVTSTPTQIENGLGLVERPYTHPYGQNLIVIGQSTEVAADDMHILTGLAKLSLHSGK